MSHHKVSRQIENHRLIRSMGIWQSRSLPGPFEIEEQVFTRERAGWVSCSTDPKVLSTAGVPCCVRARICVQGEFLGVCELSWLYHSDRLCLPSSIEAIGGIYSPWIAGLYIAFELGSRLRQLNPESLGETAVPCFCVPASVQSFTGRFTAFPPLLELLTFEWSPESSDGPARCVYLIHGLICQVPVGHPHFAVGDGSLMSKSPTTLVWQGEYCAFRCIGPVTVDSSVEEIGPGCFAGISTPTVTFSEPSRLHTIGTGAFQRSAGFCSIVIPSCVEVIREQAFEACFSLQEVRFQTGSKLRLIEQEAFRDSAHLQPVDVPSRATIKGRYKVLARVRDVDGWRRTRVAFAE
jgi:hypothetical protein